jgi:hypothetical protein
LENRENRLESEMLTSRERVTLALNHREPDRVPLDLGASPITGMHVSTVYCLRQALQLDKLGIPVKVIEPFQMLGEIKPDLQQILGVDVVGLGGSKTMFGFKNEGWKTWTTFDGTPVLVPFAFNTDPEPNGDILMYPEGDKTVPPSGRMPNGGWYFDAIIRQPPIDENTLNIEDNLEEFGLVADEELAHFQREAERLYTETEQAILANFGSLSFGDIGVVPAPWLKHPKGIRDVAEWYMSTVTRRDYITHLFERQCEIALTNLERIYQAVGNRISVVLVSATDFGMQTGPFISPKTYRTLYKPFHKQLNHWIHQHTSWKTFMHSCGSITAFLDDFIDAGFDILNPVQCSAVNMDPKSLKQKYGEQVTFWGGGIDTQQVLPFGTPDQVRAQVRERIQIFAPGGGFVFNSIHNVQAMIPPDNVVALYSAVREHGRYPLR